MGKLFYPKAILLSCLLVCAAFAAGAQKKVKFGDVPKDDLSMVTYAADTSASAVVLYEDCEVYYTTSDYDLRLVTKYTIRVKVLKPAGLDEADASISYYTPGNSFSEKESVSGVTGYVYNMENDKVVRTKLGKEHIFEEKTTETRRRIKLTFPNVKVGSVFEYKYELSSPYYWTVDDFYFQRSIPVVYSRYRITIPEYFRFSKKTMGYSTLAYSEKQVNVNLNFGVGAMVTAQSNEMTFEAVDLPSLKNEDYVWNMKDYMTKVVFDLASVQWPSGKFQNFARRWPDIEKLLREDDHFGKQFKFSNLLKDELAAALKPDMTDEEKLNAILTLVRSKITWNKSNTLTSNNVKSALKEGTGSSGEMNALLMCLLRDAGYNPYPVVMSLRSRGRIMVNHPSMSELNYFIVGVDVDNKPMYMDASAKFCPVNTLHTDCMVQEARCVREATGEWVDLSKVGRNTKITAILASFNENGNLSGKKETIMTGVIRVNYYNTLEKQKDKDDYQKQLESEQNCKITSLELNTAKQGEKQARESYEFETQTINLDDDFVYLNPLVFPMMKESMFKSETRVLPIEFNSPYDYMLTTTIEIPEGYEVDELPKSEKFTFESGSINYTYTIRLEGRTLQTGQRITLTQILFPATEYEALSDFFIHVANKSNSQIVLKKKEEQQ